VNEEQTKVLMRSAVAEGIKDAIKDEETVNVFWDSAFRALSTRAQARTGKFVLGGLSVFTRRVVLFLTLAFVVYTLGGWAAVVKLWSVLWSTDG
jgi:hypothetical protein